jgi:predicted GNAT superfamily acetyltransferase
MLVLKFTSHDDLESTRNLLLIAHVLTNARTRTQDEKRELYDDVYAEASRFGSVSGLAIPTAPPHIPPNQVSNTALSSK